LQPASSANDPAEWGDIEALAATVRECTRCGLSETRTNAVPGEGSDFPAIMFIGEGPGFNEDQQGRPFVGRAGALLDLLLESVPLKREDVYITNVVKCRPPDNRDPAPEEVSACWPYLEAQIRMLRPRVIATLGRHSLMRFFPDARISSQHGQVMLWRDGIVVFPLYHPAAGLRSRNLRMALEEDVTKLPQALIAALEFQASSDRQSTGASNTPEPGSELQEGGDASEGPLDGQIGLF
jgi:uracil-DNA glycosylase